MPTGRVEADQEDWSMPAARADDFADRNVDAGRKGR
jgi:hypothetical protein